MKKSELFQLLHNLRTVSEFQGVKFACVLAKNIRMIQEECVLLQKLIEETKDFKEYEMKRIKLAESFANKNEDGSAKIEGNEYDLSPKSRKEFEIALKKLNEDHAEALEARKKQLEEFNVLLEEETDLQLYKIKESSLPADINAAQVLSIYEIVDRDE